MQYGCIPMSSLTHATLNVVVVYLITVAVSRTWAHVVFITIFEVIWVFLFSMLAAAVPEVLDLSPVMATLVVVSVSAVELVLGFLGFVIYVRLTTRGTAHTGARSLSFYYNEFKKTRVYAMWTTP